MGSHRYLSVWCRRNVRGQPDSWQVKTGTQHADRERLRTLPQAVICQTQADHGQIRADLLTFFGRRLVGDRPAAGATLLL